MSIVYILLFVVSVALFIYLWVAVIKPEKF